MELGHTDVTAHTTEPLESPGRHTTAECRAVNSILARIVAADNAPR